MTSPAAAAAAAAEPAPDALFLGLDCSTQSMSAVVTDARGALVHECSLRFDDAFPAYGTTNGVLRLHDGAGREVVEIPSLLFVDALDAIFAQLAASNAVDLARVACVSGSAQQHASVYWSSGFSLRDCMDAASPTTSLVDVLKSSSKKPFYYENGPSWMDSSTAQFCEALETAVGGYQNLSAISGSRAYERFTGNQIAKRLHDDPAFLDNVGRIALVSSMLTSLLCGEYTPIDESDGSGMNLMDVRARKWSKQLLEATTAQSIVADSTAPKRLEVALGEEIAEPYHTIGELHPYFQKKFGFSSSCVVVPFSGDNPCTLAGIGLGKPGDVGVSLGTSSTLMTVVPTEDARLDKEWGHFFSNPVDPRSLMAMICFKNGSLTRQGIRDRYANGSWDEFNAILGSTPAGNGGYYAFYFSDPEIMPPTNRAGEIAFDSNGERIEASSVQSGTAVRGVVESQFLMMRIHAEGLGVKKPERLIVVGGASANAALLQVLADVFDAPVVRLASLTTNSAALGGALRAQHGLLSGNAKTGQFVQLPHSASFEFAPAASPDPSAAKLYTQNLPAFANAMAQAASALR